MISPGAFVRITQDAMVEEPLVEGMVGKVVPDIYGRTDPAQQAMVVVAGARKPCPVPLEAVELISETDYGEDARRSRTLWRQRRELWRDRYGRITRKPEGEEELDELEGEGMGLAAEHGGRKLEVAEIVRRAEAVAPNELSALARPPLVGVLTEWSVGALDVLADELPGFHKLTYGRARKIRNDQIERWLWDGVRLYLAVRSFHPALPPPAAEPSRERVRALFERIDEDEAADRLSEFCLDVNAVKEALGLMAGHWLNEALNGFAKGLKEGERPFEELAQYILQLHIVGFQVGFCADSTHHGIPTH